MPNYPETAPDSQRIVDAVQALCEGVGLLWVEDAGDDLEAMPPGTVVCVGESGTVAQEFSVSEVPLVLVLALVAESIRDARRMLNDLQRRIMADRSLGGLCHEATIADYDIGRIDQDPGAAALAVARLRTRHLSRGI